MYRPFTKMLAVTLAVLCVASPLALAQVGDAGVAGGTGSAGNAGNTTGSPGQSGVSNTPGSSTPPSGLGMAAPGSIGAAGADRPGTIETPGLSTDRERQNRSEMPGLSPERERRDRPGTSSRTGHEQPNASESSGESHTPSR